MANTTSHLPRLVVWLIVVAMIAVTGAVLWNTGAFRAEPTIALVTPDRSAFWEEAILGAREAAERYGAVLDVRQADGTGPDQNRLIDAAASAGAAGLAVSPLEASRQAARLREIGSRMPLVTLDSDSPLSDRICFVGADNYTAGRQAAELVREALPEGGTVVISMGSVLKDNGRLRRQGLIDGLLGRPFAPDRLEDPYDAAIEGEAFTIAATLVDENDPEQARQNIADLLAAGEAPDCIVALYGYSGPAVARAVDEAGMTGTIKVVGFDYDDETLAAIERGAIYATMAQDPYNYGYHAVRILAEELNGGTRGVVPLNGILDIRCFPIRADNLARMRDRLQKRRGGEAVSAG